MTREEARAKAFAPKSVPIEFDGVSYTVVEPPTDVLDGVMLLPTARLRAATIAAACLRFDGVPFFDGPWEAIRLPPSQSRLPAIVMEAVLEMAKAEPTLGVDVAAASPEEVLKNTNS